MRSTVSFTAIVQTASSKGEQGRVADNPLLFWICWFLILLSYIALRINALDIPLDRDEGGYGYVGQLISAGELPYRDAYNHKPPLVWYLFAFALHLVPATAKGVHLFAQTYNFFTLVVIYFIVSIGVQSRNSGLWAAFVFALFSSSPAIQGYTASTELFSLLPLSLSLLFAVLLIDRPVVSRLLLSGLFGAAACWIKPPAFTAIFFIFLFSAYLYVQTQRNIADWKSTLLFALSTWLAGALVVSFAILGYFHLKGVLGELLYWSFEHNLQYTRQGGDMGQNLVAVGWRLLDVFKDNPVIVILALGSLLQGLFAKPHHGVWLGLFLVF